MRVGRGLHDEEDDEEAQSGRGRADGVHVDAYQLQRRLVARAVERADREAVLELVPR
jgi:hypothetical protein